MILLIGPAGAGKSTQGQLLAERLGWVWMSAGQLLRDSNNPELLEIMNRGELVPSHFVNDLMVDSITATKDKRKIALDGFTRKIEEVKHLINTKSEHGGNVDLALVIDIDKENILKRLKIRSRNDDTPEVIEERLAEFHRQFDPIIDYLKSENVKVAHINGVGTIEEIYQRIQKELAECKLN